MKPLPEKRWWKLISLIIGVALPTFIATSCLAVRVPEVPLNIDQFGRTAYLELTKKLIFKKDINGCVVYIYSERTGFSGKTIELVNTEQLETIVEQAINDFPEFVSRRHGLIIPKKETKYLVIVLASKEYFRYLEILKGHPVNAFTQARDENLFKGIYFKVSSSQFDITVRKSTIRHEIFHWIAFKYGLDDFFLHDAASGQGDAYDFGGPR